MKYIYYVSFAYVMFRTFKWFFKFGEEARNEWTRRETSTYKSVYYKLLYFKGMTLSIFSPKYRMIKKEMHKDYSEPISDELVKMMVKKQYVQDIREMLNPIFEYKKWKEYNRFHFEDNIQISRRQQFSQIKATIDNENQRSVRKIIELMLKENKMVQEEANVWNIIINGEKKNNSEPISQSIVSNQDSIVTVEQIETRTVNKDPSKRF